MTADARLHSTGADGGCVHCREKEAIRAAADAEARRREADAERQRQEAYRQAQDRERARVHAILSKTATKMHSLDVSNHNREHENARLALVRQLELNLRLQKVRLISSPAQHAGSDSIQLRR